MKEIRELEALGCSLPLQLMNSGFKLFLGDIHPAEFFALSFCNNVHSKNILYRKELQNRPCFYQVL